MTEPRTGPREPVQAGLDPHASPQLFGKPFDAWPEAEAAHVRAIVAAGGFPRARTLQERRP